MPLHLKYRPKTFAELEGNQATVNALQTVFGRESDFPHAILLAGPAGSGKTTAARVIATTLGCHPSETREYDLGDLRGIDNIRDIRQKMVMAPMEGKVKVYILDEAHSLTGDAQKALLKSLEDTPKHVYFILCTTDPDDLSKPILSRCMTFTFESLPERNIVHLLKKVLKAEAVEDVPEDVLAQIAQDSLGSCRTALVILDKIIDMAPEKMKAAAAQRAMEESKTLELCRLLMNKSATWSQTATILNGLNGIPAEKIRHAVLMYAVGCLRKGQENLRAFLILDTFKENYFDSKDAGIWHNCYAMIVGSR